MPLFEVDGEKCNRDGICAAECPGKAIDMYTCSDQMLTGAPSVILGV